MYFKYQLKAKYFQMYKNLDDLEVVKSCIVDQRHRDFYKAKTLSNVNDLNY